MRSEGFEGILQGAKAGADWAWREIYQSLSPVVLGYVRGRGAEDPDDLLGQVFMQAVRAIGSFSGDRDAFRAWVLTIARRRLIDEFRKRDRRPTPSGSLDDLEAAGPTGDSEREAIMNVEAARAIEAICTLSPDQQDVLLLRLLGDLTLEEVAKILRKSVTAVKALQHRGLATLSKRISPEAMAQ